MKLYKRHFILTAGMILFSFLLLGITFIAMSYRYAIQERNNTLRSDAEYVSTWMGYVLGVGFGTTDDSITQTLSSVAQIADVNIMVTGTDGTILTYTNGEYQQYFVGKTVNAEDLTDINLEEIYTGRSTLGIYDERHFVAISPITLTKGMAVTVVGYAIVTTQSTALTEMWEYFSSIFMLTAVVVMVLALILSHFSTVQQTRPLEEMANAATRFGQGEFDVRVDDHSRRDEVGQLARAFNAMADSLALSETKRQEFVANISHELKTPMTTISGFTDGILDGTIPPEKTEEYLRVVSAETKRLSRLVRKMLDISKLQGTENITGHEQFDLCEVMCQMLLSLESKIVGRGLDVDVQIPEDAVMVWGEPDAITQVGYNLMDNAIKFAYPRSVITLSIVTRDDKALVTICNQGPTIPPEELKLIFDRFHKSDKSRSIDKEGVGLGLYIVKTILNNHKESITVTSENESTAFTFTTTLAG